MARIRNIKPDFWTDEKLVELEPWERLLFIGIWNFVDDEGYMPYSPKRITMQIFPGDSLEVSRGLQNLISIGALTLYDSTSGQVLKVTNWEKHQKVSNPTKSKYPLLGPSPIGEKPRKQAESSMEILEDSLSPTELSRKVHKEGEGERVVKRSSSTATPSKDHSKDFNEFWMSYPRKVGKQAAIKAHEKALKLTTPEKIIEGVESLRITVAGKDPQFTPHPATWLHEGRWDDEDETQVVNGPWSKDFHKPIPGYDDE